MRGPIITFKRARRLRREMSLPEVLLWQHLRGGQLTGLRFRRQHPVGPYVLDFYCAERQLRVEIDGSSHDNADRASHDERRTVWLAEQGIRVLRVSAVDVLNDKVPEGVLQAIVLAAAPSTACGGPPPPSSTGEDQVVPPPDPPPRSGERGTMRSMVEGATTYTVPPDAQHGGGGEQ